MNTIKQKLLFFGILIFISPLVIGEFRISSITAPLIWILIPYLTYLLLATRKTLFRKILVVLFLITYALITFVFLFRFILCGHGSMHDKYVSRSNSNLKIIGRDFSCYGTMGDLVLYKQYTVSNNIKLEIYYKTFTEYKNINIDTSLWKPVTND